MKPVYLDYMATTPVDPRVIKQMVHYLGPDDYFGNPASHTHSYGIEAATAVAQAREQIAASINAHAEDIIFTSGATEANNLALLGAAHFYKNKGRHLITLSTEHKSILDGFQQLEKEGFEVSYINPEANGLLELNKLAETVRKDTILVSIMQVNNEIGVIQNIAAIGELLKNKGIIFHVDAAQSAGKLSIDLQQLPVHLMSFSAHKNYGPKGIGALFVRSKPRIGLEAQTFGGGQERGLRSGTLAPHQIVGMGMAFGVGESERIKEQERILHMRQQLWNGIKHLPGIQLNGDEHQRVAGSLNLSFAGLDGDAILLALNEIAISTTSACASASRQPSYVLKALGLSDELVQSSIRLSIGRFTQKEQIQPIINFICTQISGLHKLAP